MSHSRPKLSVIIVSYNTKSLLDHCLESVFKELKKEGLDKSTEVIVVDNNSSDGSPEMVRKFYPRIHIIRNRENNGFAKANNQGIRQAKADDILLLNSDTLVGSGLFRILTGILDNNPGTGAVGPKLLNPDRSLQSSAGNLPDLFRVFLWMTFLDDLPIINRIVSPYHNHNKSYYKTAHTVGWISGACFMFKTKIIPASGLLNEDLFMYGEEVEWCHRINAEGYKIYYTPEAEIIHLKGGSGQGRTSGIVEEFRFIKYYYRVHKTKAERAVVDVLLHIGALLRIILFGIIDRGGNEKKLYIRILRSV